MSEKIIVNLLEHLGENPDREGLRDTPKRVLKAYGELLSGAEQDPAEFLATQFEIDDDGDGVAYSGIVLLKDIEFYSLCEHHMLPFIGSADVAYIPGESGKVVGLSKLARVVDVFARRLQTQERMTAQIADAICDSLNPLGCFVRVRAAHLCMRMRGVGKQASTMITSEARGVFRNDGTARAEILSLLEG